MTVALTFVSLALALTVLKLLHYARQLAKHETAEHAKCTAHVAHYVGNAFAARVLEAAAADYDTTPARAEMARLSHTTRPNGQSLPAAWLLSRAAKLDPANPAPNPFDREVA